jgi:hypothetical protein
VALVAELVVLAVVALAGELAVVRKRTSARSCAFCA